MKSVNATQKSLQFKTPEIYIVLDILIFELIFFFFLWFLGEQNIVT